MDDLERSIGLLTGKLETHMTQETLTTAAIFQKLDRVDVRLRELEDKIGHVETIATENTGRLARISVVAVGIASAGMSFVAPWVKQKLGM